MTAKEYLSQYKDLNDSINAKLEQVGELRRKAQTVSSGSSDGAHSSTPRDRIGEITVRIVDLEREINEDIDRSIDLQREIRAAIATVPDVRLRTLLEYKYINLLTLDETAVRMKLQLSADMPPARAGAPVRKDDSGMIAENVLY